MTTNDFSKAAAPSPSELLDTSTFRIRQVPHLDFLVTAVKDTLPDVITAADALRDAKGDLNDETVSKLDRYAGMIVRRANQLGASPAATVEILEYVANQLSIPDELADKVIELSDKITNGDEELSSKKAELAAEFAPRNS